MRRVTHAKFPIIGTGAGQRADLKFDADGLTTGWQFKARAFAPRLACRLEIQRRLHVFQRGEDGDVVAPIVSHTPTEIVQHIKPGANVRFGLGGNG